MAVQVKDRLSGIGANVGDETIASTLFQSQLSGYFCSRSINAGEHRAIIGRQIGHRCNVAARNEQDMLGSLGVDIPKGYHILVLVYDISRYFTGHNLAEQAILHG